jgi:hypothetical protein
MKFTKVCGRDVVLPDPKNNEAVFTYVANFLLNQKERCVAGDLCSYRSKDRTNACAAGCLIPDDEYNENMETGSIYSSGVQSYFEDKGYSLKLLNCLQLVHDSQFMGNRLERLQELHTSFFN